MIRRTTMVGTPMAVWVGLGLLLAAHAAALSWAWGGAFSSPDANGYLVQARQLAESGTTALHPSSPAAFVDLQYLHVGDGEFRSRYPPGLAALQAIPYRLGGVPAALAVNPILALVGGLLLFLLVRRWAGPWPALLGVLLYVSLPVLSEQSLMGMAHVAVTTALLGALLLLDRWSERPSPGRALALGLVLGVLPSLRYPAVLSSVTVAAVVALRSRDSAEHRRTAWAAASGFVGLLVILLAHNTIAYGGPLTTGYSLTGEDTAFSVRYLGLNALGYLESIRAAAGAVALAGIAGLLVMARVGHWRGRGLLLLLLTAAPTLLYGAYYWSLTGPRFLLPVFAVFIVAAVCLVHLIRHRGLRVVVTVVLVTTHLTLAVRNGLPRVADLAGEIRTAEEVLSQLRAAVPAGSVLIAPLPIRILAEPYGEWKLAEPSLLIGARPELVMPPLHDPPPGREAVTPLQPDKTTGLREPFVGLSDSSRVVQVIDELVRWSGAEREVFFVGGPEDLEPLNPHGDVIGRFLPQRAIELPGAKPPPQGPSSTRSGPLPFWIPRPPLTVFRLVRPGDGQASRTTPRAAGRDGSPERRPPDVPPPPRPPSG